MTEEQIDERKLIRHLSHALVHHDYIVIQCSEDFWSRLTGLRYQRQLYYVHDIGNVKRIQKIPSERHNIKFRRSKLNGKRPTMAILKTGHNNYDRQNILINQQLNPKNKEVIYY